VSGEGMIPSDSAWQAEDRRGMPNSEGVMMANSKNDDHPIYEIERIIENFADFRAKEEIESAKLMISSTPNEEDFIVIAIGKIDDVDYPSKGISELLLDHAQVVSSKGKISPVDQADFERRFHAIETAIAKIRGMYA
jgi:hypothetical protein